MSNCNIVVFNIYRNLINICNFSQNYLGTEKLIMRELAGRKVFVNNVIQGFSNSDPEVNQTVEGL